MKETTNNRTLFIHCYNTFRRNHALVAVHENIPADLTVKDAAARFGLTDRHTAYIKEASGERIYVQRHPQWRGSK